LHTRRKVLNSRNRSSPTLVTADDLVSRWLAIFKFVSPFPIAKKNTVHPPLEQLKTCNDPNHLGSTLRDLCAPYGTVAELGIFLIEQAGHHQAMCFWHMQSEAENVQIMQAWGVGRFGGELVAVVDLAPVALNDTT